MRKHRVGEVWKPSRQVLHARQEEKGELVQQVH